jgi:hypothetical protein
MRYYVKCVQCGRVAGVQFTKLASINTEEEETPEENIHLDGYIVKCPACCQHRLRNPPASVRMEIAAILTGN